MYTVERDINHIEAMLARSERNKGLRGLSRFAPDEVESIKRLIDVAKTLNTLLDLMDRQIPVSED